MEGGVVMNIYKQIRLEMNLTQKEMSEVIGVTIRAIQNYEAGVRVPKRDYQRRYQELSSLGTPETNGNSDKDYLKILKNIHKIREELDVIEKFILEHIG